MKVFTYHTPERVPSDGLPDCAIAVDVLRATTTIAAALAAGAEAVQVFSDLEQLIQESDDWPADQRIRVGERGGQTVAGFDLGNSPLECHPERVQGCRLFMSTTNGTRALERIQGAPTVLAAALINRATVGDYLQKHQLETVWIVGSGWQGSYSLEDTVCAGAIAHYLSQSLGLPLETLAGNDETIAAIALYDHYQDDLLTLFHQCSHGQRLLNLGNHADLKYCAQIDTLSVLPIQAEPKVLVKTAMD
ncbi:2-phosphosulfolactate phosphatase family protein [Candidatus Synechococcus calcipolaris G9]|uniref:Probable 2-phosphosulfolactate phosphatase n=1 Tax=Candidatus Synechococcus calcipolaris G9 TaxID=1497997 RepID=A0ABT6EYL6_9SYNE|nr:2-phosphosulfolactate phosphatase family protein [Candidatus Synechococcus calcipolaris]MDG2990604.1 2-phosphosulfolactate phosphatase family protein [Candidatus Synechococcus calcipolaris G9]